MTGRKAQHTAPVVAPVVGSGWRRASVVLVWLIVPILAVMALIGTLSLTGAAIPAPDWMAKRAEAVVNDRLGGGVRLSLPVMRFVVDERFRPQVNFRHVGVFDGRGSEIAVLNEISARISPSQAMRGARTVGAVTLRGAQITIRRGVDGNFDLSFGPGQAASGDLARVLDAIDMAFDQDPLSRLGQISAEEMTITLEDSRSGRLWQVTDGQISVVQEPQSLSLTLKADVFNGSEDLASTLINIRTEKGSARATLTANFENAQARDIAAQSPVLTFLSVLDAPISGAIRTSLDAAGQISGLTAALDVGRGALRPTVDTPPIGFQYGQVQVAFDPETRRLGFSRLAFETEAASISAEGQAFLREFRGRWPEVLEAQFRVSDVRLQPKDLFAEPMEFDQGALEFRVRLDPFSVQIGQISLGPPEERLLAKGRAETDAGGWRMALDISLAQVTPERVLSLWPIAVAKGARTWVAQNVLGGTLTELNAALRLATGAAPVSALGFRFSDASVKALKFAPPIEAAAGYATLNGTRFTAVLESGTVRLKSGHALDVAGTVFQIPDTAPKVQRATVTARARSSVEAGLSFLNLPPLRLMDKAETAVDVAQGRVDAKGTFAFDLIDDLPFEAVDWSAEATLTGVETERLVPGRRLTAASLGVRASPDRLEIGGNATLNGLPVSGTWEQPLQGDTSVSRLEGTVELSQAFLDAFKIGLPRGSLSGAGQAQVTLSFAGDAAPRFSLRSDLNRVGLRLAALGWAKARNRTGRLEVDGRLGKVPAIDRIALDAGGLRVSGVIDLNENGGLRRAQFDRVRVGGWLDGPVTLIGRGSRPPAVQIRGGQVDMRRAELSGSASGEPGGPMSLALNRLVVSEGIVLTDFRGEFKAGRGMDGSFTALVNGRAPIRGTLLPTPVGAAVRIVSDRAGAVFHAAGILKNLRRGTLDLTLNPSGQEGIYNGRLKISNTRMVEAPAMTELINAISIVGLIEQAQSGAGIGFSDVEAEFQISPNAMRLLHSSAVGPSIGVSLDGVYNMQTGRLSMQGVLSPVYFLNGIGQLFTKRREGLFGFSFQLSGQAENPRVRVNPLSILTPGAFREIFRRPAPKPVQTQ